MTRPSTNAAARHSTPLLAMTLVLLASLAGGCSYTVQGHPPSNALRADRLANGVALASGAAAIPSVRTIGFTYVVREGDTVKLARTHNWDFKNGTDTVSVGDRMVTVNLKNADTSDPAQADALNAWASDSRWLAAGLKLFDPNVRREYVGRREVEGKVYEVLGVTFPNPGDAPPDRYNLYVDPYTSLVAYSDRLTGGDTADESTAERATWERYQHRQNLVLPTYHRMGPQVITIENLSVAAD
jgi:hypothetical protein